MAYYRCAGVLPPKHFMRFPRPEGGIYHEELVSSLGFQGPSSLVYRLNPPTRVLAVESMPDVKVVGWDDTVRNHLFHVDRLSSSGDFAGARRPIAFNDDITFSVLKPTENGTDYYRNGYCDELVLVTEGTGVVRSIFGDLTFGPLDYVYIPRGTTVQWLVDNGPHSMVVVESNAPIGIPARFRNTAGQLLERSPYHERDLRAPVLHDPDGSKGQFRIVIKTGNRLSRYAVDSNPFDVVGWDGSLYPFALSMRDYEPITGLLHQMPDMYQVFETAGAAICNVTPRRLEDHPDRAPAQAHHSNLDYDEILYRIRDETPASERPRISGEPTWKPEPGLGTITVHRRAIPHGPKDGYERRPEPERIHIFMLMVDTVKPLTVTATAMDADDPSYVNAWL
jgi:homogentisate 1,2-dioxygenase